MSIPHSAFRIPHSAFRIPHSALPVIGLLVFLLAGTVGAGQLVDRIVAVVDDDIILWSELQKEVYFQLLQRGLSPEGNEDLIEQMQQEILTAMIDNQVLVYRAREDSIEVDEQEIEEMLREQVASIKGGGLDDGLAVETYGRNWSARG